MRSTAHYGVTALAVLALASNAPAQIQFSLSTLVREFDEVPGVGLVTRIDGAAVNDNGTWLVNADTDNGDLDADAIVLRDGSLYVREGDPLAAPSGAAVGDFDAINLTIDGNSIWNFFLDNAAFGEDSGIYFNETLTLLEGAVSSDPQLTPGTRYLAFFGAKPNAANQAALVVTMDDPNTVDTAERALVRIDIDPNGVLLSETTLAFEGWVPAGQTEAIAEIGTGAHQWAMDAAGSVLYLVDLTGDSSSDGVIYLNDTPIAQEGGPSPVAGRNYEFLLGRSLDLGNGGDIVFKANLDGATTDDDCIIRNGAVFAREGDPVPGDLAQFSITSFGVNTGPVQVDDFGDVVWYAEWDDPNGDFNSGLFFNDTLIVQEGVSQFSGLVIDTISSGQDAFQVSDNGRYVIFEGTLFGGINGAFLVTIVRCPGDYDFNGALDLGDLGTMFGCWNQPCGDITGDGTTNLADLGILFGNWGPCD